MREREEKSVVCSIKGKVDSEPIRDKLDLKNQTKQEKRREGKQTIERVVCGVVWYGMVWYDTSSSCNAIYPIIISYYTILC